MSSVHPTLSADDAARWPLPGAGQTRLRWQQLVEAAATDLVGARLLEAHADAAAILHELAPHHVTSPGQLWGVWAAEPPTPVVLAHETADGAVLTGRKLWCSGAHACTHALISARAGDLRQLYAVDLTSEGVRPVPGTWHAVGMAKSDSGAVDLLDVPAIPVGSPGEYLTRPGFWHGAIGVAACWHGGALALAQKLRDRAGEDPHRLAHLGAVDAGLFAAQCVLDSAADDLDRNPLDRRAGQIRARRVRAVVESVSSDVIDRVGRALGAGPLCADAAHAQLAVDLTVYLRQSHAEHDLADLGRILGEGQSRR